MGGKVIARGIGLGVLAMALNVGAAFLWVYFYSIAINPGHDGAFYQAHGQIVAPILGVGLGIPLMIAAGWLSARGTSSALAPLIPAIAYILLDIGLAAGSGLWPPAWSLVMSVITKFAAAWAGGAIATRSPATDQ